MDGPISILAWLAAGYLALVLIMYLAQRHLVFPAYLASFSATGLPSSARPINITASDGTDLAGVVIDPGEPRQDQVLLLAFGGNVWNVESMALRLHRKFPSHYVAGFHYRGYGPSGGKPSATALLADALEIFDRLQAELPGVRTVAIGFSIGTPVAAHLARHRTVAGVVLVTPFDDLVELARDYFPWLPVRRLIRHRMSTRELISEVRAPTAIIAAERDSVVPERRTEPLRRSIPNLVFDRVISGADHNDLYDRPEFWAALGEALRNLAGSNAPSAAPPQHPRRK